MKKITLLLVFTFASQWSIAQPPTIGLLYQDANVSDGYVLFTPEKNNETYLVNNCGEKINQWNFSELPGATCYLLPNGNLIRAGKDFIQIRDWNNNLIWSYATTDNGIMQHHDIHPLPNGNVLCLVNDSYSLEEITALGRNPAPSFTSANLKLDKLVELHPTGLNTATIVWEWKFKDHLIQDFDATKLNYGVVGDHSELLDINYNNANLSDYIHCNGIDYNAALDQILISARNMDEIYIIDHSTTTAEAAGHTGGTSGHGGDFLWRWGNPVVYKQGTVSDRKLFRQHCSQWVESGYSDDGKITVFNNGDAAAGSAQTFTSVVMIQPEIVGGVYTKSDTKFNPTTYDWSWNGSILGVTVYEDKKCGTHAMPNGNIIISETSIGRVSEITKAGTILWSYKNPTGPIVSGNPTIYNQFTSDIPSGNNGFFRAEKYPTNFAGFAGQNMTPNTSATIENQNSLTVACTAALNNDEYNALNLFILNPANNHIIQFNKSIIADNVNIFDTNGRLVYKQNSFDGDKIEVNLSPAVYLMQIKQGNFVKKLKIVVSQ